MDTDTLDQLHSTSTTRVVCNDVDVACDIMI